LQTYFEKLGPKNLQNFCHCFILNQMIFARIVESKKDTDSLGLLVKLVENFVGNLEKYIQQQNSTKSGIRLQYKTATLGLLIVRILIKRPFPKL